MFLQTKTAKDILLSLFFITISYFWISVAQAQWRPTSNSGITQAPALELKNLSDITIDLRAYKGKVVLVNFWASWCEPCREEFTELAYLQERFGPRGLKVFAVNLAEMKPRILQFLQGNGLSESGLEILQDRNSIAYKTWKARGLPSSFLVNKQGKIEGVWIGAIENADNPEVTGKIEVLLGR